MNGVRSSLAFVRKVNRLWKERKTTKQIAWELGLPESVIYNARAQGDGSSVVTHTPFPKEILAEVSHVFGVSAGEIRGRCRLPHIVAARWSALHIAKYVRRSSYSQIGRMMGLDHSSVIHAISRMDDILADPSKKDFQDKYWAARNSLETGVP